MIDKPHQQSLQNRGGTASVPQGTFERAQLFAFKKKMAFSAEDYILIFCLAVLVLLATVATYYINPLDYFHVISNEQLQDMVQTQKQGTFLENLKEIFQGQLSSDGKHTEELWRAAGWNGVWAFLCFLPQAILGWIQIIFPSLLFLFIILNRNLKEMVRQLEKSPK